MRKTNLFFTSIAASAVILGVCGCGKDKKKAAIEDAKAAEIAQAMALDIPVDDSVLYDLYNQVDALLQAGQTNQANEAIIAAFDDKDFEQFKAPLFNTTIRYFLFTEQYDAAKGQYLNALRVMPEIATPGFDTIYGAYMAKDDVAGALDWARVLATQDIGEELRLTATDWLIGSLFRNGKLDEMATEVAATIEKFDAPKVAPLIGRMGQEALGSENVTIAEKVVELIGASSKKDDPAMKEVVATLEIRIDAAKGNWKKIADRIPLLIVEVPDQALQQAMMYAFQSASRAARYDMVELMAAPIVMDDRAAQCEKTRYAAAREWVGVVFEGANKDVASFPSRIDKLLQVKLPPSQIHSIYSRYFYDIIGDIPVLKECVVLVDKLIPMLTDQASQDSLRSYQLDSCFLIEDYTRALAILEKGLPERDEAWHKMAIVKVKAHKALQEKNYDDAVKYFREFMGTLKDQDTTDPASEIVYSQATLFGNNEKRIGDIYTEAGNADEAKKAYETALEWFGKALETNKAGAETENYIKAQIQTVPTAKAKAVKPAAETPKAEIKKPAVAPPVVEVEKTAAEAPAAEAEKPAVKVPALEVEKPAVEAPAAEAPTATPAVVETPAA